MTFIDTWLFWLLSVTQPNAPHVQVERPVVTVKYVAPKASSQRSPVLFSSSVAQAPHEISSSELLETSRISNGY